MSGTHIGGIKARDTNLKRYGDTFYQRVGAIGGRKSKGGGFNVPGVARRAGSIGGKVSRRPKDTY